MDASYRMLIYEIGALCFIVVWFALGAVFSRPGMGLLPWGPGLDTGHKGIALGAAAIATLIAVALTRLMRHRRASYVGEEGLQLHVGYPWGGGRTQLLLFSDCAELRVMRTRRLLNGAYQRTTFRYEFFDRQGASRFPIVGHFDERTPNRPSDAYRFALAAQSAWNARPTRAPGSG